MSALENPADVIPRDHLTRVVGLSIAQERALREAVENGGRVQATPSTRGALRRLGLAYEDQARGGVFVTDKGRRQVRWYADDLAAWWGVKSTGAIYKARQQQTQAHAKGDLNKIYLPEIAGEDTSGRHVRPFWHPDVARAFVRPGVGRRTDREAGRAR